MTREEAIKGWIIPALKNTWNEKKNTEILKALEQEPCEDAISRQAVLDMMQMRMSGKELYKAVYDLPSVNPQPKTGCWKEWVYGTFDCSECGKNVSRNEYRYCPYCGAKMKEGD